MVSSGLDCPTFDFVLVIKKSSTFHLIGGDPSIVLFDQNNSGTAPWSQAYFSADKNTAGIGRK